MVTNRPERFARKTVLFDENFRVFEFLFEDGDFLLEGCYSSFKGILI